MTEQRRRSVRRPREWTLALSWGAAVRPYVHFGYCKRVVVGPLALTFIPHVEVDALMQAYAPMDYWRPDPDVEVRA